VTPKLLAVDLDGTLLDPSGEPHAADVAAIRAALAAGVRVSIVTGRLYSGTRAFVEQLGLAGPIGCADGSHMVDARDHGTLLHHGVRGGDAVVLRSAFERAAVPTFVFARDAIGHDAAGSPFVDYVATWSRDVRVVGNVFEHALWDLDEGVTAVVALGTEAQMKGLVAELKAALPDVLLAVAFAMRRGIHAGRWAMLVRHAAGTKGNAIRWIARHEGLSTDEIVAVGDWINDVPMFEACGRSFAMGQAPDDVKAKATDALPMTSDEGGGVAAALREAFGVSPA
jgi:hydroxymethylpyrimidine pyrophosphatase-like HAD family hydrolase